MQYANDARDALQLKKFQAKKKAGGAATPTTITSTSTAAAAGPGTPTSEAAPFSPKVEPASDNVGGEPSAADSNAPSVPASPAMGPAKSLTMESTPSNGHAPVDIPAPVTSNGKATNGHSAPRPNSAQGNDRPRYV